MELVTWLHKSTDWGNAEMSKLYLECYSGISGDMMVAALLDLGASREVLEAGLSSLAVKNFKTEITRVSKSGLDACDFNVILEEDNHDHEMEYLHGYHHHDHEHHHEHVHEDHEHHHHHEHRGLNEILEIIDKASITEGAKATAVKIFKILAEAESKAHGVPAEEVHFHEVGAVDSIVDIVSVAVCLDNLGIDEVIVPVLYEGTGYIRCQHGVIPIPVPATANIVKAHGLNLHITNTEGEFVTPTGAAVVAAIKTGNKLPSNFSIVKSGIGAGKRNYERPSLLRAFIIEENHREQDCIWKLESNLDDCTGEALGYVMDKLMEAGARDVHYTPVYMKKNRPGYELTVICDEEKITALEEIIFNDTTTIGIRKLKMERTLMSRKITTVKTSIGEAEVKICSLGDIKKYYPEYESVAALASKTGLSFQKVYTIIEGACHEN